MINFPNAGRRGVDAAGRDRQSDRMKPRFTGMTFFVYPVRNMARARKFYGGVPGLKRGQTWKNFWVEFVLRNGGTAEYSRSRLKIAWRCW